MILKRELPAAWVAWNRCWGAPYGHKWFKATLGRRLSPWRAPRLAGRFAFQANTSTRMVEYPWAYHAAPVHADSKIVEIGGSLSGFQFVLASQGANVINVDPGPDAPGLGWLVGAENIEKLNRTFRTDVQLRPTLLQDADIAPNSIDLIYCISTIEHIPPDEVLAMAPEIARVLKPGGQAIFTVDLFLDLSPFTELRQNRWGENIDVQSFVAATGLELEKGDPAQLFGFSEFDELEILKGLDQFTIGEQHPVMAQAFVLRKR